MNPLGKVQLLIIDPQNDFCDIAGAALPVPGANADLDRTAALVERLGDRIDAIHVTLDSHHPLDIAHPTWWSDENGEAPAPFTTISVADVDSGRWVPRDSANAAGSRVYVHNLAEQGRYQLIVWPEHCLIGSWGHNVQSNLAASLNRWGRARMTTVNYVRKGENPSTEHYSAILAEVPDHADASTLVNTDLLRRLQSADTILIAGEALSHCVASTVRDIADQLGPDMVGKLTLLEDCCSPVSGFESTAQAFVDELVARGMGLTTSSEILRQAGVEHA